MDAIRRHQREFAYHAWANREALRALRAAGEAPPRAAAVMAHLVGTEWHWLGRLGRPTKPLAVWPDLSFEECEAHQHELASVWQAFLADRTPAALDEPVRYTNSKGERFENTVADVLTHLLFHGAYHRGQLATLLGRAGHATVNTDFIDCVRRGHLGDGSPA